MVLLDLVSPQTVFSLLMAEVHLVGKERKAMRTDLGIPITPTVTYADCPADLDVLFVPGGLWGSVALMDDGATLEFLADRGRRARYVTSVCTGSLLLGAAGLLNGYRATSHWYVRDLLPLMGAAVAPGPWSRIAIASPAAASPRGSPSASPLPPDSEAKSMRVGFSW